MTVTHVLTEAQMKGMWEEALLTEPIRSKRMLFQTQYPDVASFPIAMHELQLANHILAVEIQDHPEKVLKIGMEVLFDLFPPDQKAAFAVNLKAQPPTIRITDLDRPINIKDIRTAHLGKLFSITGRIRKSQEVRSKIKRAAWKCRRCGNIFHEVVRGLDLEEPLACDQESGGCGCARGKTRFDLIMEMSDYRNFQVIYLEEMISVAEGQPQTKMVFLWDDLVGVFPCNRATITGVIRLIALKKKDSNTAVLTPYIEANSIKIEDYKDPVNITSEDEEQILAIAHGEDPIGVLRQSIAPSIYGMDEVKAAIILQQAGGCTKVMPDQSKKRGNIHILIIGDPGIAKSTILKIVVTISPLAFYGSGEGTTGAGLTFSLARDEFDGTWSVEMGLLPMCDTGLCIFDELDKTDEDDRKRLHSALESGELPVAKAGIVTTLSADASLLAGANPKMGRFDPFKDFPSQIELSQPLISRFDLIFPLNDVPSEEMDQRIADHILAGHREDFENLTPQYSAEFLRKYFFYVRKLKPTIPLDISDMISRTYSALRQSIPGLSPRSVEAIIRLSEASAKIRANPTVDQKDVELALCLFKNFLKSVSTDPTTGNIDAGIITSGMAKSQQDRIWMMLDSLKDIQGSDGASVDDWKRICEERGYPPQINFEVDIERLKRDGRIYERFEGRYKLA